MTDVKISQLPSATTPLTGAEIFPLVQNGVTVNSSLDNISTSSIANVSSFTASGTSAVARTVQSKLRDMVSVKDFGATGDGATDDTAAFNAAFAAADSVYIPEGTYLVENVNMPSGTKVYGAGVEATTIKGLTSISVPIFVNNATQINGVEFHSIKFVGYVVTDGFSEQVHLMRLYNVTNVIVRDCHFIGSRADGIYLGTGSDVNKHNTNILIESCFFDGINNDNRNAISVIDADGLKINNCTFVNHTRNGTIVNATAITTASPGPLVGVSLTSGGGSRFIDGAQVLITPLSGSATTAVGRITTVAGSIVSVTIQSGGSGYTNGEAVRIAQMGQPGAIDIEPNQTYEIVRNCQITNNTFTNCKGNVATISIAPLGKSFAVAPKNFLVSNNIFNSCVTTFAFYDSKTGGKTISDEDNNFIFTNNQSINCEQIGFLWGCKTAKISNNTFIDPALNMFVGINTGVAYKCLFVDITDNQFHNCATNNCIYTFWADYLTIANNLFLDCGTGLPGGSNAMDFASSSATSYVKINNNSFVSPLGKTAVAVQVEASHTLTPETNQFYGNYVGKNGLTNVDLTVFFRAINSDYAWTTYSPIVAGTSSAGTGTYTSQFGRYQKIGRMVHFHIRIIQTAHTGTGQLVIQLPTSSNSDVRDYLINSILVTGSSGTYSAGNQLYGTINASAVVTVDGVNYGGVRIYSTNNAVTTYPGTSIAVPTGAATYSISGVYESAT